MTANSNVTMRLAQEGDLAEILQLYAQDDFNGDSIGLAQAQALYRRNFQTPGYQLWVADSDGSIIATASLMIMENIAAMGRHSAFLESVVVDENSRGQHVGRRLIEKLCEAAKTAGAYKVCLFTSSTADYVRDFYEDLGFERHGISYQLVAKLPEAA